MTATAWDLAATTTVEDNTPETLARRLRAHLQAVATQRLPITYWEAAKGAAACTPEHHSSGRGGVGSVHGRGRRG
jgi:hypothetical protein